MRFYLYQHSLGLIKYVHLGTKLHSLKKSAGPQKNPKPCLHLMKNIPDIKVHIFSIKKILTIE